MGAKVLERSHGGPNDERSHGGPNDERSHGGPNDERSHGGPNDERSHGGPNDERERQRTAESTKRSRTKERFIMASVTAEGKSAMNVDQYMKESTRMASTTDRASGIIPTE